MESFSLGAALFGLFVLLILGSAAMIVEVGPDGLRLVYPAPMRRLAARVGIDLGDAEHSASRAELLRAIDTCEHCRGTDACRAWLDGNDRPEAYRLFCPNAALLERLARCADRAPGAAVRPGDQGIDKVSWPG